VQDVGITAWRSQLVAYRSRGDQSQLQAISRAVAAVAVVGARSRVACALN